MATRAATHVMTRPQEASQAALALSSASDIAFARAIAAAIRATPGIANLSPGLMVVAATYGPHERVTGVVVRHDSPYETAVEVHVIVELNITTRGDGSGVTPGETSSVAILAQVANKVRATVDGVAFSMNLIPLATVDVLIDDIRFPE